jgi:putative transposase
MEEPSSTKQESGTELKTKPGKHYSPAEKKEILDTAQQIGIKATARKYGVSIVSIYQWRKEYKANGIQGLEDGRSNNSGAKPIADWKRDKVLAVKETDPGYGPSQIRNQLRREGITISNESIRIILKDGGYRLDRRHAPAKDYIRFEASRPLELVQIDICEFYIHKQKVYLVLLLDDYSRFLLNFALLEQCNMEQIERMVGDAIQRYGKMERLVSDRGFVFHGWRGINAFEKFLEELDIFHIHTSPYHPQTIGKIEAVNKSIQKELLRPVEFVSVAAAREKIADWIWRYNYHRVHQGLDGLCVPADRFHGWLAEVERGMAKLVENGIDLSLRQINLFSISLNQGKIELTIFGRKAYIEQAPSQRNSGEK